MYRVNNAGEFNAPFGRYKNPNIINEPTLKAVSKYLNLNNITINNSDFADLLAYANKKTFVYLAPLIIQFLKTQISRVTFKEVGTYTIKLD